MTHSTRLVERAAGEGHGCRDHLFTAQSQSSVVPDWWCTRQHFTNRKVIQKRGWEMRKTGAIAILSLLVFGVVGCSGGSSSGASAGTASGTAARANGTYSGSLKSSVYLQTGKLRVNIHQSGNSVSGTFRLSNINFGGTCFPSGTFTGTVQGTRITLGAASSGGKAKFSGTITANHIDGSYRVTSGYCSGDRGSFHLSKS